jgi:hypothetical protein
MATNTGRQFRRGAVRRRSQTLNSKTHRWINRGTRGRFVNVKSDAKPFKGVRRER